MKNTTAATIIIVCLIILGFAYHLSTRGAITPADKGTLSQLVREILAEDPSIVTNALEIKQKREREAMLEQAKATVVADPKAYFGETKTLLGNPNGDIVIVEFMDYQCTYCKHMAPLLDELIAKNPSAKVIIKNIAIFGEISNYANLVALAAAQKGKFAEVHNALLASKEKLDKKSIDAIAAKAGIDKKELEKLTSDAELASKLKGNQELAVKTGVRGTPFYIFATAPFDESKLVISPGAKNKEQLTQIIEEL